MVEVLNDQTFRMEAGELYVYLFYTKQATILKLQQRLFSSNLTLMQLNEYFKQFLNYLVYGIQYPANYIKKNPFYKFNNKIYKTQNFTKKEFRSLFKKTYANLYLKDCCNPWMEKACILFLEYNEVCLKKDRKSVV